MNELNGEQIKDSSEKNTESQQNGDHSLPTQSTKVSKSTPLDGENQDSIHYEEKIVNLPQSASGNSLLHLTDSQRHILDCQLDSPAVSVSFFKLYRFADAWDCLIIAISVVCAIAAGAALPLLSILIGQMTSAFQAISLDSLPYDEFESLLVHNVLYVIYVGVAELVTVYISTVGFIYTGEHITLRIREEYLRAILRQNMAYFDNLGAGEITTRITADTNLIQDGISQKVGLTLTAVATFITAFIIAYVKFWKLALICTSVIVTMLIVMSGGSRFIIKFSKKALNSSAVGGSVAEEVLSSIRTATAFGTQVRLAERYEAHLRAAERYGIRMQIIQALMIGSLYAVTFLNYSLGFWQGSRFLLGGHVKVGEVLTILMAILTGSFALGNVAPNSQAFTSAMAAAAKIYSTIDRHSPLDPTSGDGRTLERVDGNIELRSVKHVYPSRPEVLVMDGVSLSIPAGRTTAIVGPSGSGKSTIIGLVERFYNPIDGNVLLDGVDVRSLNLRWLRQQISLVGQEPTLFSTTIFENIRHGLVRTPLAKEPMEKVRGIIENAARMANAHEFIISLPDGYETHVGERGFLLSGGQKQRIAIARAVVSDPKILMLDEATSALDTKSEEIVQAALDRAAEGRTTIVIAHRLSTVKNAHNIVVLANGSIAEQGTHNELLDAKGVYYKLVEAQRLSRDNEGQLTGEAEIMTEKKMKKSISRISTSESGQHDLTETDQESLETQETTTTTTTSEPVYSTWSLLKFIASFNRSEFRLMTAGFAFAILAGSGQPVQAVFYSKAINTLSLPLSQRAKLKHDADFWSLMLLIIAILQFFFSSVQGICFGISAEKLIRRARSKAFRSVLRQDVAFFDENTTGGLTSFLSAETKHLSGVSGVILGTVLIVSTTLTASITIALAIGWKLALVCISIVPVLLFCGFCRVSMLAKFQARSKKAYEASAGYACEATSAIRTVASLSREDDVLAAYRMHLGGQLRASLYSTVKSSLFYALSQALTFFCIALGFWYGGTLLGRHLYSIFQFFVCFSEVIYGSQAAGSIFSNAPDMGKAKNAAAEFKKLFDRRPVIDVWSENGEAVESETMEGAIEFRNVHFRYPTRPSQPVLNNLSLKVKPKQYVALVGSSGCGKSTTIALLERFYDVMSGGIYVDGKDISRFNVNSYRSQLALVSQEPTLYQGTIRDNILLGTEKAVTEEAIIKACKEANIYEFIQSLPEGFHTPVGGKGGMLSGGQKQRVAIARALLRNPKILLLDEATSALDSESEKVVQAALDAASRGRTTIAVAHRLSTIQKADVIYVFDQGHMIESGTHHELIRKGGRYSELVRLQNLERSA